MNLTEKLIQIGPEKSGPLTEHQVETLQKLAAGEIGTPRQRGSLTRLLDTLGASHNDPHYVGNADTLLNTRLTRLARSS